MLELTLQIEAPPLCKDESGGVRVGNSRVLLEVVIHAFEDGATAEAIAQRYPTTTLAEIYSVIAYYLRHRDEVKGYLQVRDEQAKRVRERIEANQRDFSELRERIIARQQSLLS